MVDTHDVTIIIPQYGHAELTLQCLAGLQQHEPDRGEIIVVDDGSPDGAAQTVADQSPRPVTVLEQPQRGVTAAWNLGLATARTRWVVLLNNDVVVHGPWLEALLSPLTEGPACLTGPCWRIERLLPPDVLAALPITRVLEGWCLAGERELLRGMGSFNESLQLYWSDTDLQLRLVRDAGPEALQAALHLPLQHLGHRTTGRSFNSRRQWREDRERFLHLWTSGAR